MTKLLSVSSVKAICAGLSLFALGACQQLLPIGSDPERTFSLRYDGVVNGKNVDAPVVFLDDPLMAEGLGGQSVTVLLSAEERTSLRDARWATALSSLIRDYLDRSMMANTSAEYVGEGGLDVRAGCRLQTKVWSFELVPGEKSEDDQVNVNIEASLVSLKDGELLARLAPNKFELVEKSDPGAVVAALSAALKSVSHDIAGAIAGKLDSCHR